MSTILVEYYNQEGNYISRVTQHDKGFSVSILDLDAMQNVGIFKIFPTLIDAKTYAQNLAN